MATSRITVPPQYCGAYALKTTKALIVWIGTFIYGLLQLVNFTLQGIKDWISQFIMLRIILFPFTYWWRYKYEKDENGWFTRKRRKFKKPISCECELTINPWQFKLFEILENILGYNFYYDLNDIQLLIEIRINARKKIIEEVAFKTFYNDKNEITETDYFTNLFLSKVEHWIRISYIRYSKRKRTLKTNSYSKLYICHEFGVFPKNEKFPKIIHSYI